ncbi:MAG: universal stress protein [Myxococcales bacterium]|nr:universal stress protein [Myxococcales bacterium]
MFKKLVVGVDFSEHSDRAVKAALQVARSVGGSVVLVGVIPSPSEIVPSGNSEDQVTGIEHRMRELAAELSKSSGVSVDYGVEVGHDPAGALTRFVATWGGDALVVGTSARTGLNRVLVGSIAERVLRSSTVPVLVIGPSVAI